MAHPTIGCQLVGSSSAVGGSCFAVRWNRGTRPDTQVDTAAATTMLAQAIEEAVGFHCI
jgi:hypothetical protein